jgi:hypothetical protein
LGSGRIFPVAEETIAIDNREFPSHWPRIGGMDFGWDQQLNFISTSTSTGYVVLTHSPRRRGGRRSGGPNSADQFQ